MSVSLMPPHQLRVDSTADVQGRRCRSARGVGFSGRDAARVADSRPLCLISPRTMESSTKSKPAAKPVQTFRLKAISASVFENQSEDGKTTFYKVSLQRTYRQDDEWRTSQSFSRDDLPIAALLLQKAWEFILNTEAKGNGEDVKE